MKIFIVEDNASHLKLLKAKVASLNYTVVGSASSPSEALKQIKNSGVDVILLDINLDGDNEGIDLAAEIKEVSTAEILFITSQRTDKVISKAIETGPSGYLMKPVEPAELKANIELAMLRKQQEAGLSNQAEVKIEKDFLTVRTGKKLQLLPFKNIKMVMVEIKNHVTLIDHNDKQFVIRESLKKLLDTVLYNGFIRTHHSYAVNIDYISYIDEKEQMLYLSSNDTIPIGKAFKKDVYQKMNIKS